MPASLAVRLVVWLWLLAALAVGHYGILTRLPGPAVPVVVLGLTALLIVAYRAISGFRRWVDGLDLRMLVLFHVTRFVGFYFLVLYRNGVLPYSFAVPGGIGDITVAILALVVVLYPFTEAHRLRAIYIWNVVGLIDILLVVLSAVRIALSGSNELIAMSYLPLSLIPTFLVPVIIASHIAIFARLSRGRK